MQVLTAVMDGRNTTTVAIKYLGGNNILRKIEYDKEFSNLSQFFKKEVEESAAEAKASLRGILPNEAYLVIYFSNIPQKNSSKRYVIVLPFSEEFFQYKYYLLNYGGLVLTTSRKKEHLFGQMDRLHKLIHLTSPVTNRLGCPSGWTRAGRSCYLISQKVKKWSDAVSDCSNYGANILKVDSKDEKSKTPGTQLAKGLRIVKVQRGIEDTRDSNCSSGEDCATISQGLTFNDDPCSKRNGFICEAQTEDMGCPPNWQTQFDEDESTCYFISNYTADWNEARAECDHISFPIDSYLLAINSQNELDYINKLVLAQIPSGIVWFTGLNDIQTEGQWRYDTEFNNPPDMTLIHWKGSPQFINGREKCALVFYGGRYTNIDCDAQISYICEKPAILASQNDLSSSVESSRGRLTYLVTFVSTLILGKQLNN
ncbi:hypothetical protein CHS0354_010447 [Potamilus streckersoni]|uniref:C-type lectin domain-containing protein n=1 Tax=Potamilus streckersoni TaxID=2493646 RepID=A0AAE0SRC4_9BIVA|nr:hypothetical protein CHS0354_010447 [Potamilus streckersoni]